MMKKLNVSMLLLKNRGDVVVVDGNIECGYYN